MKLGYQFYPPEHQPCVGHPRLDIILAGKPAQEHFDPEFVVLTAALHVEGITAIKVSHPWHGSERLHVCAGRVTVTDRTGKDVHAFTFGGTMRLDSSPESTLCVLTSSAPILDLAGLHCRTQELADEIETLIARRRAFWSRQPNKYEQRLASADPVMLYLAGLTAIEAKLEAITLEHRTATHHDVLQLAQLGLSQAREQGLDLRSLPPFDDIL